MREPIQRLPPTPTTGVDGHFAGPVRLGYGRKADRSRARIILASVALAILVVLASLGMKFEPMLQEKYERFRYRRAFESAASLVPKGNDLVFEGSKLDAFLRDLVRHSRKTLPGYYHRKTRVLFAHWVKIGTDETLQFACMSPTGIETYTFSKADRQTAEYEKQFDAPSLQQADRTDESTVQLTDATAAPLNADVMTTVSINGRPNTVQWSLPPAPLGTKWKAKPKSGWERSKQWWPSAGDFEFGESRSSSVVSRSYHYSRMAGIVGGRILTFRSTGELYSLSATGDALDLIHPGHAISSQRRKAIQSPEPLVKLKTAIERIAVSPDGDRICYVTPDKQAYLREGEKFETELAKFTVESAPPFFLEDGTLVLATRDRILKWEPGSATPVESPSPGFSSAIYLEAGSVIVYQSVSRSTIQIRHADSGMAFEIDEMENQHHVTLSPNGKWLALKGRSGFIIYDTSTGQSVFKHVGDDDLNTPSATVCWAPDGQTAATSGRGYAYVWSMESPKRALRVPYGKYKIVPNIAVHGNGVVVTDEKEATILYWPIMRAIVE